MAKFTTKWPFFCRIPKEMAPFASAGRVDDIFRPRMLGNGIFATATGCGVSFSLPGIDSEGLDRNTLNQISKHISIANRCIPVDCLVFEYMVSTTTPQIPAREIIQPMVAQQARERADFLEKTTLFKSARLFVTLYVPGKIADDESDFSEKSRAALRKIQNAAGLYEKQLSIAGICRLSDDELVQFYSYLLNFERSLMTQRASPIGRKSKKLGRVHIGMDGDYLRVGKHYCQMLSMIDRPRGTRPNVWAFPLLAVDCEMIWCSIWQRKPGPTARRKAIAVENAIGMAGGDIYSATVGGYNPMMPPPRKAATVAQEKKVEKIGEILDDLDGEHYYGHYTLFGMIHSRDKGQVDAALPIVQNIFSDPAEVSMMEEGRGAVSAYVSCFPGQQYNVRQVWLRGDHKANLSFVYSPFLGHPWSEDLQDEYTMVYQTRQGTPFFFSPFVNGNGNTTILGSPGTGKSLNANAIFTAAMKHGGKTFIFDQGGSYESNVRALGGVVTRLGLERPRLNPFAGVGTKDNIHAVSQLVRMMLNKSGVAVGNADQDAIDKSVERLFDAPAEIRRLKHLKLPTNLAPGLKRWVEGGIYGSIFDNIEDDLKLQDLQSFDFGSLGDKHGDLLEVEMSWILMRCRDVIRDPKNLGIPKHIIVDEIWKCMGVVPVLAFVLETIKADRKNLAWATLVTQSLEDFGTYAAVIKNACPNTIFLGGAFDRDLYKKHFRLNATEIEELESLGARELALKVDGDQVSGNGAGYFKILQLNMDPAAYARATTKPTERLLRDRLVAELGEVEGMNQLVREIRKV